MDSAPPTAPAPGWSAMSQDMGSKVLEEEGGKVSLGGTGLPVWLRGKLRQEGHQFQARC